MTIYVKYSGSTFYMAFSTIPSCGCGMGFAFDPDDGSALDGDEFSVGVFDDPFSANGDRFDSVYTNNAWASGSAPAGIVTACPSPAPQPPNAIPYEWSMPFSALGITAGSPHTFKMAIYHSGQSWPPGITPDSTGHIDPTQGGSLSSSSNWH